MNRIFINFIHSHT